MTFEECVNKVGVSEGKYSTDKKDRGNWSTGVVGKGVFLGTKYGISGMTYPKLDIKNLTWEQAKAIYKRDFWDAYKVDEINDKIKYYTFDSMVNHGQTTGIKLLQRAIGVTVDGVIGPKTIGQSYKADPWKFHDARNDYYAEIVQNGKNDSNDLTQLKGWLRRNSHVLRQSI